MMEPVYFDHAATTPLAPEIAAKMLPFMTTCFGNPSSTHCFGRKARAAVAQARVQVAALLEAEPEEIFFTSGGSESDNWALKGIAFANAGKGRHILTTQIEHPAVLAACAWLEQQGFHVTYLPVDAKGKVSLQALKKALSSETILVSVMAANNEVGTLEPLQEIAALVQAQGAYFHTDAVQATGHIPLDMRNLPVDALSFSGHKLYGPKGIGVLYLRRGTKIMPLIHGGEQERGLRAGTENTAGIVGLGWAAVRAKQELLSEKERLTALRRLLWQGLRSIEGVWLNGDEKMRLPGNLNFGIAGISNESLLIRLDLAGFAVSAGSACSSGSLEPSHVLQAMGQSGEKAGAALRVTLGRGNTKEDIEHFLQTLKEILPDLKKRGNL